MGVDVGDNPIVQVLGFGGVLRSGAVVEAATGPVGETPGFTRPLTMSCQIVDDHVHIELEAVTRTLEWMST